MPRIKINKKRLHTQSDEAYTFTTSAYGGEFFHLPKSRIETRDGKIVINDVCKEDCLVIDIPSWLYIQKEQYFKLMSTYNYKLLNK